MTGRRLYDLFCDAHARRPEWQRDRVENGFLKGKAPPAWPFLTGAEQSTFSTVAARLKGVRR